MENNCVTNDRMSTFTLQNTIDKKKKLALISDNTTKNTHQTYHRNNEMHWLKNQQKQRKTNKNVRGKCFFETL